MASVFRKSAFRPIPATATIHGDTAKWTPRGSRRPVSAPIRTLEDGRRVIEVLTGCYYAKFADADGRTRTVSTGCRDEGNARQYLAAQVRKAELIKSGVMTRQQVHAADGMRESIGIHFAVYLARMTGKRAVR